MNLILYINEKFVAVLKNRISELVNSVYFDVIIKFIGVQENKINNLRIKVSRGAKPKIVHFRNKV